MKKLFLIVLLLQASLWAGARQNTQQYVERVRAYKVSYITDKLALTPEQAEKFWPVYRQQEEDLKAVRRKYFGEKRRGQEPQPSFDEAMKQIDGNLDYQTEVLELRKRYKDRFLKVISPQQLVALYDSEKSFRQLLLQKIANRKGKRWMNGSGPQPETN